MKRDKKQIKGALLEVLLELLLYVVFFGIGALILFLFGVKIDVAALDFELILLIGCAPFTLFGIVFFVVYWIRKKMKNKDE